MYGTTMIATLADGVGAEQIRTELETWEKEHQVDGFLSSHVMLADDGTRMVNVVVFETKQAYEALADDPRQDAWWREHFAPLVTGEPQWIDGTWIS